MRSTRRIAIAAAAGTVALATAAPLATAGDNTTSFQNGNNVSGTGSEYTGILTGALVAPATLTTGLGTITCTEAPLLGNITSSGGGVANALGNFATSDFKNTGTEACSDDIGGADHVGFSSQGLPWNFYIEWDSDNTAGMRNAHMLLSGVSIFADLDTGTDCTYRSNFQTTGNTTKLLLADVYNPDNSPSENLEVRVLNAPFDTMAGSCVAAPTAQLTATWQFSGAPGAGVLSVRNTAPIPPAGGGGDNSGSAQPVTAKKRKCKKKAKKKSAAAAKKCKKKKRK